MSKTYRKDPMSRAYKDEDKLLETYDKLASRWARRVEAARKSKAQASSQ